MSSLTLQPTRQAPGSISVLCSEAGLPGGGGQVDGRAVLCTAPVSPLEAQSSGSQPRGRRGMGPAVPSEPSRAARWLPGASAIA